jgi:hypothetical protein
MDLIAATVAFTLSIGLGLGACRIALGTIFFAMARNTTSFALRQQRYSAPQLQRIRNPRQA